MTLHVWLLWVKLPNESPIGEASSVPVADMVLYRVYARTVAVHVAAGGNSNPEVHSFFKKKSRSSRDPELWLGTTKSALACETNIG